MKKMSESTYKNFIIKPKIDFGQHGYLIDGKMVKEGWVVTDHRNVNVLPGATWFQTIEQSKLAIDVLLKYGENNFWAGWNKEKLNNHEKEIKEIKRQINFIGESVIETCKRQRGGFDFLEGERK